MFLVWSHPMLYSHIPWRIDSIWLCWIHAPGPGSKIPDRKGHFNPCEKNCEGLESRAGKRALIYPQSKSILSKQVGGPVESGAIRTGLIHCSGDSTIESIQKDGSKNQHGYGQLVFSSVDNEDEAQNGHDQSEIVNYVGIVPPDVSRIFSCSNSNIFKVGWGVSKAPLSRCMKIMKLFGFHRAEMMFKCCKCNLFCFYFI